MMVVFKVMDGKKFVGYKDYHINTLKNIDTLKFGELKYQVVKIDYFNQILYVNICK
jgi:hypothetical protein